MKKILFLSILLLATLSSCQQAKAEPTLQKGMKKIYVTECISKSPQHDEVHMSTVQQYEVVDETPEGYVLDIWVKDFQRDEKNPPGMSMSTAMDILKGRHTQYITDKEGRVLRCLSINEVKEQYRENYMSVHEFSPHGNDSVANEEWRKIKLQEDLASFQGTICPLALNGKDIKDGLEEEYTDLNGFKLKRTFHVKANGSIQSKSTLNMTAEELGECYRNIFKKMGLKLTDEAQKNIDYMVKDFHLEYTEEATYTFQPDGWVKTIDCVIHKKDKEPVTLIYKVYCK